MFIDKYIKRIVSFGAIDNLIKGAAGNAVQSMNIMNGFYTHYIGID